MIITDDQSIFTEQATGQVFKFRSGHLNAAHLWCYQVKLPNLKLKTQPKQLLGYLLSDIVGTCTL